MARPSSQDPLDKFRWSVSIDGFQRLGFTSCGVPAVNYTTQKYPEGGAHYFPRHIIDSVEYEPVTLSRGVTSDQSFYDWAKQCIEVHKGRASSTTAQTNPLGGNLGGTISRNTPLEYHRDVTINHLDRSGRVVKTYILYKAIPVKFVAASEFASDADDLLSMEKLVLEYEGFEVISRDTDTNPTDIRDVAKRLIRSF